METFKNLKVGDVLSETSFYKVEKIVKDQVQLQVDGGESVVLDAGYVNGFLTSASQFDKEEKVSKTEMTELLLANPRTAITVNYNKLVKEADVVKEISEAYDNSTPKEALAKMKAAVKRGLDGEERTIVGRHYSSMDGFGYLHFIDMNVEKEAGKNYDTRQRLVNTRGLNWLIVNRVKYSLKK